MPSPRPTLTDGGGIGGARWSSRPPSRSASGRWRTPAPTASPSSKSLLDSSSTSSTSLPQTLAPLPHRGAASPCPAGREGDPGHQVPPPRRKDRRRTPPPPPAPRALAARADIDATHARRLVVARDLSSVRGEIEEAERKEEDWERFYESKRKEMEEFQAMSQRFEEEAYKEVQRLKDLVSQLQSALQELQSSGMYSNDAKIAAAEARTFDLTAKAKLDESLASARQFRGLLQQQLQKAFASQVGDQKAAEN